MNRGVYATASGMVAAQTQLDRLTQNLANLSTVGFKREESFFGASLEQAYLANAGKGPFIGTLGNGVAEQGVFTVLRKGPISETGNSLDVAINDDRSMFAIETGQGVRYTRNGSFARSADGYLITKMGEKVLNERGSTIELGEGAITIDELGTITQGGVTIDTIGVFAGTWQSEGGTQFRGTGVRATEEPVLIPESLEGSNVDGIAAMVQLVQLGRNFEMAQRSISQQDELTQRLIQSLGGS